MRRNSIAFLPFLCSLILFCGCNQELDTPQDPQQDNEENQGPEQEPEDEAKPPVLALEWIGYMEGYNTISAPAVAPDGSVYAATDKDHLYKFSADGVSQWKQPILSDPSNVNLVYATPTIDEDGTVYIASGSSNGMACCVAFNPDGSRKWTFTDFWNKGATHSASVSGGMAAIGKSNIYIGNHGNTGTIIAISKADGQRKGYVTSGSTGPTGGARSGVVLSGDGMVHWFGGKYGVWGVSRSKLDNKPQGCPYYWNEYGASETMATTHNQSALACVTVNGKSCVAGVMTDKTSTKIYAVDSKSGMQTSLVRIQDTATQDQGGVVVTAEGYLVASLNCEEGKENGGIVIVDPMSSTVKMRFNLRQRVTGAPAVDNAGNIHFFTEDGEYYIVKPDYATGKFVVKEMVNLAFMISENEIYAESYSKMTTAKVWCSAVIGNDGKIYTCFTDKATQSFGGVICLSYTECKAPADTDWPMIGADPCHTSRQKGLVIDESVVEPDPDTDVTPYPSLVADALSKGQSLISVFESLIAEQSPSKPRSKVFIVAHRANTCAGIEAGCPDNSIAAIQKAIDGGADMIELDVRTTKDGQMVLMHDATIDATTNGSGNVTNFTLEELRSFSMERGGKVYLENGQPVRVPTLEEALRYCKGKIYINLDLKAVGSRADLIKLIQDTQMQGQVMLYCSGSTAKDYQSKDKTIAVHPHIGSASDIDQYSSCPGAKLFQYNYGLWLEGGSIAKDIRAKGFLSYSNLLNYDTQTMAGNFVYIDRLIDSETDFIQTDYCEFVASYLRYKGLR